MKIMIAARALIELLVIVAEGYEKVMTVDQLKEASLNEVDFTREEREIYQQRLISAISSGSTKDVHSKVHISPLTGCEYVIPIAAESFFNTVRELIEKTFLDDSLLLKNIDIEKFKQVLSGVQTSKPTNQRYRFRLSVEQLSRIEESVIEQITTPGFTQVSKLSISKILKNSGISREHYATVAQCANKIKKLNTREGEKA